jgi:ferredoxin
MLPCLGGLSEELLCVLANVAQGRLSIDVSRCYSCRNGVIEAQVRSRCVVLAEAGLVAKERLPRFVGPGDAVKRLEVGFDRREFFRAFRRSALSGAKSLVASIDERGSTEMSYGEKSLPVKRMLLNAFREDAGADMEERITEHFDARAVFSKACSGCFACAAACPTGALIRTSIRDDEPPHALVPGFDPTTCVSCGLCEEFCPEKAATILPLRAAVKETAGGCPCVTSQE